MDSKKYIKTALDIYKQHDYPEASISFILRKKKEGIETMRCIGAIEHSTNPIVAFAAGDFTRCYSIQDWAFSIDDYLFEELEHGFEIVYMPIETHYGVWCMIDSFREDIFHQKGLQVYLSYCFKNGINKKSIDSVGFESVDVMDMYVESNEGYEIIAETTIGFNTVVLGHHKKAPSPYVTWETSNDRKYGYTNGHYFSKFDDAFKDFKDRCRLIFDVSMNIKQERCKPKFAKDYAHDSR